jgi:hypothetical protein
MVKLKNVHSKKTKFLKAIGLKGLVGNLKYVMNLIMSSMKDLGKKVNDLVMENQQINMVIFIKATSKMI